jgi:hypothetical protein
MVNFFMKVAIYFLRKAHKAIKGDNTINYHEFAEDICSHIQQIDYMRIRYGDNYRRIANKRNLD